VTIPVKNDKFLLSLPLGLKVLNLILKDKNQNELARTIIPLINNPIASELPDRICPPVLMEAGLPELIPGPFNINLEDTEVKIGNIDSRPLLEFQNGVFVEVPQNISGIAPVVIKDAGFKTEGLTSVYHTTVTADKRIMTTGEIAKIQYNVTGLSNSLPTGVMVKVRNLTPNIIRLPEGDEWDIPIHSSDVSETGSFSTEIEAFAIQKGEYAMNFALFVPPVSELKDTVLWSIPEGAISFNLSQKEITHKGDQVKMDVVIPNLRLLKDVNLPKDLPSLIMVARINTPNTVRFNTNKTILEHVVDKNKIDENGNYTFSEELIGYQPGKIGIDFAWKWPILTEGGCSTALLAVAAGCKNDPDCICNVMANMPAPGSWCCKKHSKVFNLWWKKYVCKGVSPY
jgi:hypothetical protein